MPRAEVHHDLLQRGISGPLANAADTALSLARTRRDARERVRDRHAKVIVAVHRDDGLVDVRNAVHHVRDHVVDFLRRGIADRVRQIHRGGARLDDGLDDLAHVVLVRARGVLQGKLNVVTLVPRILDRVDRTGERLFARHLELVLEVKVARREKGVNAWMLRALHGLVGRVDVLDERTAERGDNRLLHRRRNGPHTLEVPRGGDGETRFDDVHAQGLKLMRHADLLLDVHRVARCLFAVTKCRVEESDSVVHLWPVLFISADRRRTENANRPPG